LLYKVAESKLNDEKKIKICCWKTATMFWICGTYFGCSGDNEIVYASLTPL